MDIAIIGGGAAAVGLLDALARAGTSGPVTVFEPSPHLWRGRPYGPDLDSVLVNVPPAIMSIRHGDRDHYAAWLGARATEHMDERLGHPIVPRPLYGRYLEDTAEKAAAELGVRVVESAVVAVTRAGGRLALRTSDGSVHLADQVALCVGGGRPRDHYGLEGTPGYIGDPYPLARTLENVAPDREVMVIGSGLTAIDVVVSLAARGHTGPISLVSRTGMLPYVWQRPGPYRPRHVTVERVQALGEVTLDGLEGLLRAEMAEAGEDLGALVEDLRGAWTEDPVARLRRQLADIDGPEIGRRVVQETAHTVGPHAWRLLGEADRERLRAWSRVATGVASPMVPVNAARLLELFDSGQLSVVRGAAGIGPNAADVVVNAVNPPPHSIPGGAAELAASLVDERLAAPYPSGGLVPADPRVHIVGDLAGDGPFITSGIPGVAAQGAAAARAIGAALT
ncbi:FAD/NAD(P)-binding protein [Actinomadura barringtoniae]|uniref:FAD/NAD(P)-binding protein n=1 Tax=Actinomadura barringtoniae TaxID=1427535 RepID=A0A939PGT0_9ACTN|nr:FAD/NAD(P)-binding protein [Actinomadura barringtoniae]MBO2449823.1 FAD/NAD(P)-binding protein [Actinomadura barringtoniae]